MDRSKGRGSKSRIRALSPIRETSGITPVHVIPKGSKVMKGANGHAPILVQALPPEVNQPKPTMKPMDRHYTAVDQVVSDYLHYARYGQVAPVLHGSGTGGSGLSCSCCMDRNRENVQKKLALQRGDDPNAVRPPSPPRDLPEHHAKHTDDQTPPGPPPRVKQFTVRFQDDGNTNTQSTPRYYHTPSTGSSSGHVLAPPHAQQPWLHYQPTPYAGTFLNPEFNRPFERYATSEESVWLSPQQNRLFDSVLEADSKFANSMSKLQSHLKNNFDLPPDAVLLDREERVEYS